MRIILLLCLFAYAFAVPSSLVTVGSDGRLKYKRNSQGDRIMDFSSVGYMNGRDLPDPSSIDVKIRLKPSGKDDSAAIQHAIDSVSKMPVEKGFRGAVLLEPGTYKWDKQVRISASGVVLRGSGPKTIIHTSSNLGLIIKANGGRKTTGPKLDFIKTYYPSGSDTFQLKSVDGLKVGDSVVVMSTITKKFISFLGMDKLYRKGKHETWIKADSIVTTDRIIKDIKGNNVTLDAPFPDSIRPEFFDGDNDVPYIQKYTWPSRVQNSGVEYFSVIHLGEDNHHAFMSIDSAINCWARNLLIQDFRNGVLNTKGDAKMCTIENIEIFYTQVHETRTPPAVLGMFGTQILHRNSTIHGGGPYWAISAQNVASRGPIVHYNIKINATKKSSVMPHARWSTGVLYDNIVNPSGNVMLSYRGIMGSGHGWTTGWGVIWNCEARQLASQNPQSKFEKDPKVLYHTWLVGGKGKNVPGTYSKELIGTYDHVGEMVEPRSLYLAQVADKKKK